MTNQEAIRHLKAARLMLLGKDGQPISDLYDALSIAIEALERSEDGIDAREKDFMIQQGLLYPDPDEHLILVDKHGSELIPVVRCKDCKHRDPADHGCDCAGHEMLMGGIIPMPDNWFCADGERR